MDAVVEVGLGLLQPVQDRPDVVELGLPGQLHAVDPVDGAVAAEAALGGLHVVQRRAVDDVGAIQAEQLGRHARVDAAPRARPSPGRPSSSRRTRCSDVDRAVADVLKRHATRGDGHEAPQWLVCRHWSRTTRPAVGPAAGTPGRRAGRGRRPAVRSRSGSRCWRRSSAAEPPSSRLQVVQQALVVAVHRAEAVAQQVQLVLQPQRRREPIPRSSAGLSTATLTVRHQAAVRSRWTAVA